MLDIKKIKAVTDNILPIVSFINIAKHEQIIDEDVAKELKDFLDWLATQE